jgi:3-oxoadipate CoA-transferase, beta subunit
MNMIETGGPVEHLDRGPRSKDELAAAVAAAIPPGSYVNLGIGQPTTVADARPDQVDPDLINAGKMPVTELPGASYFHHADSFAMMRGGHLDVCVLGAYQVSEGGDLANWHTDAPGAIPAVGGAMDLAIGAKSVFIMMTLFTKDGPAKLVPRCTYPLTGVGCVDRIYTDYATIMISHDGAVVTETFGASVAELQARVAVTLRAPNQASSER